MPAIQVDSPRSLGHGIITHLSTKKRHKDILPFYSPQIKLKILYRIHTLKIDLCASEFKQLRSRALH